jgi:hypothetical protein
MDGPRTPLSVPVDAPRPGHRPSHRDARGAPGRGARAGLPRRPLWLAMQHHTALADPQISVTLPELTPIA